MIDTRETLLGRLKAEDAHEAWKEFYHLYWGAILRYACKLGLNETQAQDVLQETMVVLMRLLPEFVYDRNKGKFRNFLLTIVHRKSLGVLRRTKRNSEVPWSTARDTDSSDPFQNDEAAAAEARRRWNESLMEEAIRRVRDEVKLADNTFAVFQAYVIEHRPAAEVAKEFGIKENAVYQIRNRVLRRVQAQVHLLRKNSGEELAE